ncbi:MAG TPA: hypothetical protein VHY08_27015, partial [Bacillota bacterium]|nr:hypothetical protein [Bacillota bacterium]
GVELGSPQSISAYQVNLPETGMIESISVFVKTGHGKIRLGVYSDISGKPGRMLAVTGEARMNIGWNTVRLSKRVRALKGLYWICFRSSQKSVGIAVSYEGGNSVLALYKKQGLPTTFPGSFQISTRQYSIYATLVSESPIPTVKPKSTVTPTITVRLSTPTPTDRVTVTPTTTPTRPLKPTPTPTRPVKVTPTPTRRVKVTPTVSRRTKVTPTATPKATPTVTITRAPSLTATSTQTPTPTAAPTQTSAPTPTSAPTATSAIIPEPTPTPTPEPTPTATPAPTRNPLEWLKYRNDQEMTGHSSGTAQMLGTPGMNWSFDYAGWSGYYTLKVSENNFDTENIPYRNVFEQNYFFYNTYNWGLGTPRYDLTGAGHLTTITDNPAIKVGKILPATPGLQKVVVDNYYQVGDQARARLYAYDQGSERLVWTSEAFATCYSPVVCVADANNDGQPDVIITMHYRIVVLNGATGATLYNLKYYYERNYGFLGVANIDDDPEPEFCIISDFAQHIEVIDNNNGKLSLKWMKEISNSIEVNNCTTRPGPTAFADVDGDKAPEVICSIYNYYQSNQWAVLVFNGATGMVKYTLYGCFLNGLHDLNNDGRQELFVTKTSGEAIPTYGDLAIYQLSPEQGMVQLWACYRARFHTQELGALPLTVNTMAADGRRTVIYGPVSGEHEGFFISSPGPYGGEVCTLLQYNESINQVQSLMTVNGPKGSLLDVTATKIGSNCDYQILLKVSSPGAPYETLTVMNGIMELKQWSRTPSQYTGPPCIADLEGDGRVEVIISTGTLEIICLEAPQNGIPPRIRWRMTGQGMTKNAPYQQDGVLVADLDNDHQKEIIFARETSGGTASLVAVRPDGSIKWEHSFPGLEGSAPVWNLGGVTYWQAGNFATLNRLDVYVSIRRNKMHSDIGFLLNGENGNIIWERTSILIPGGDPVRDIRGHGGDRIAAADLDRDGVVELISAYPDRVYRVDGPSGNPTIIKSTINSLFPNYSTYYAVPVITDFNGDGQPEIFYGRCGYLTAMLAKDCNFLWRQDYRSNGDNGCNYLQGIGSFYQAGRMEIGGVYKNTSNNGLEFRFYNGSNGELIGMYPLPANLGTPITDVVTADLDQDGVDEALFGQGTSLVCMEAQGIKWTLNLGAVPSEIALGDINGDGLLEIAVCNSDGYLKIYH